jgi:hypothetical protein
MPAKIKNLFIAMRDWVRDVKAELAVAAFHRADQKPHGLPGLLIVTLTSYPPRYPTLYKTLRSLLMQSVRADRTILWISGEASDLPPDVLELCAFGLELRSCDELRSYKKIIPALELFPEAYLVTADDDLYYGRRWLETIVNGATLGEHVIVCRRAHRPRAGPRGFAPYFVWHKDVVTKGDIEECLFPTSGAGTLFPPDSLAPEVTDRAFLTLCPHADDVWLFVMALRAGTRFRQVGGGFAQVSWKNSQSVSLMQHNLVDGGNDKQLEAVLSRFPI